MKDLFAGKLRKKVKDKWNTPTVPCPVQGVL